MSEMWRWVDPRVEEVGLKDLRAYPLARGWKLRPFVRPQVLVFEEAAAEGEEPVVQKVQASEGARDFRRSVIDTITSLSAIENRHPVEILNEILQQTGHDQSASPTGPGRTGDAVQSTSPEARA
jgi:hypothetical protein